MQVLLHVVDQPAGATGTEIARALGLPTPTVFHLVNTLVDEGLLVKFDRRYQLGPKLGVIADAFMRQHSPPPYLLEPMRRMCEQIRETVYVTAWRHGDVVVLASIEGSQPLRAAGPHTGYCGLAHARASGKCLLAGVGEDALDAYLATHPLTALTPNTITSEAAFRRELEVVRERGYAVDDEEFHIGIVCLAMPLTHRGRTLAAFSIAAPADRLRAHEQQYLDALRGAATDALEGALATGPDPD
jgi:IclR family transcriptional regulator, acetate operon repressor